MNITLPTLFGVALLLPAVAGASEYDQGLSIGINGGIASNRMSTPSSTRGDVDRKDSAYHLRIGYRWGSSLNYGVEAGHVDLGHSSASLMDSIVDIKTTGVAFGGTTQYDFNGSHWFIGLRGGWFNADNEHKVKGAAGISKTDNSGWYGGINAGYKITDNVRVGLAFDNYNNRLKASQADQGERYNTEMYSGSFEYKF